MKKRSGLQHLLRALAKFQQSQLPDAAKISIAPATEISIDSLLKRTKDCIEIGAKLSLLVGFVLIFCYIFFSTHFYPTGLTISDAFLFFTVALGFGFVYSIFVMGGYVVAQWLAGFRKWIQVTLVITGVLVVFLWAFLADKTQNSLDSLINFLGFFSSLFFLGFLGFFIAGFGIHELIKGIGGENNKRAENVNHLSSNATVTKINVRAAENSEIPPEILERKSQLARRLFIVFSLATPLFISNGFLAKVYQDFVMTQIGIRLTDVTVRLSDENYKILESAVQGQRIAALACPISGNPNEKLVHGVNLLWHGIGERSLVEFPSKDKSGSLKAELKRDGIFAFRDYNGKKERCLDLSADILFGTGSSTLMRNAKPELSRLTSEIHLARDNIETIYLIGHADPTSFNKGHDNNDRLAKKRACSIGEYLIAHANIPLAKVIVESRGAREPKTLCKDWPIKETLSECFSANRRVEARIKYKDASGASVAAVAAGFTPNEEKVLIENTGEKLAKITSEMPEGCED